MSSKKYASEREYFRSFTKGVLLTFPNYIVPLAEFTKFCEDHDMGVGTHVVEPHLTGHGHTHIVLMSKQLQMFHLQEIVETFGRHPNLKKLKDDNNVYRTIAYCAKHTTPYVWIGTGYSRSCSYEQILGHVWQYANNARGERRRKLFAQHKRLRQDWFPFDENDYSNRPVVDENPNQFFQ